MTIQTAVLIETLTDLGLKLDGRLVMFFQLRIMLQRDSPNWSSGIRKKGESLTEYWTYTHKIFEWDNDQTSNMILDDGGDATMLLHLGSKASKDISVLSSPGNEEEEALFESIKKN